MGQVKDKVVNGGLAGSVWEANTLIEDAAGGTGSIPPLHSMRPSLANRDMMELTQQILPLAEPMAGPAPASARAFMAAAIS